MSDATITPAAQRVIDQAARRPDETYPEAARRVAIDALYETRNDGGTMHDAGAAAGDAVVAALADVAEQALEVLECERRETGVDEWDESDPRTLLYCAAWEVLGEARAYEVLGRV